MISKIVNLSLVILFNTLSKLALYVNWLLDKNDSNITL